MKHITKLLAAALLLVFILGQHADFAMAYLVDQKTAHLQMELGYIEVALAYSADQDTLVAGKATRASAKVKNVGFNESYLKIDIVLSTSQLKQQVVLEGIPSDFISATSQSVVDGKLSFSQGDEYNTLSFYYTDILAPGEETPSVFQSIRIVDQQGEAGSVPGIFSLDFRISAVQTTRDDVRISSPQEAFQSL